MQVVTDTNIVVATLLKKGDTRKMLFSKQFEIFSPDRIKQEVLLHKEEFMKKSKMTEKEFFNAFQLLFENISIIPVEEYLTVKDKATSICPEGHKDDWPFIALSLKLNCVLWSQDKGLKKQPIIQVYSTAELIRIFG